MSKLNVKKTPLKRLGLGFDDLTVENGNPNGSSHLRRRRAFHLVFSGTPFVLRPVHCLRIRVGGRPRKWNGGVRERNEGINGRRTRRHS